MASTASTHPSPPALLPPLPRRRHQPLLVPLPARLSPPHPARPRPAHAAGGARRRAHAPPLPPMTGGSGGSRARLRRGPPVPALDPEQRVQGDAPHSLRFLPTSAPPRPMLLGFRRRNRIPAREDLHLLLLRDKLDTRYGFDDAPHLPRVAARPMDLKTFFAEDTSNAQKASADWLRVLATTNTVLVPGTLDPCSLEAPLQFAVSNFEQQKPLGNLLCIANLKMQVIDAIVASFRPFEKMANEGGGGPDWNGLLKWSVAHGGDGTTQPRALSEEDRKWFMEIMQANTVDVVGRMKEIAQVMKTPDDVLQSHGVTTENIEDMLDELQEHVESIDDIHSIGGGYPKNSHADIRAKAAEVVSTIVQNNPKIQQLVMESNGLEPLLTNFRSDPSTNARTKALGAISSLIRNNQPGLAAFRLGNGYAALKDALAFDDAQLQRQALHLTQYLHNKADRSAATELGLANLMVHLASSDDSGVREAALRGLLELARDKTLPYQDKLKDILRSRIKGISTTAREERQLVDSLWKECYDQPYLSTPRLEAVFLNPD